jgi:hypothetical protein
VPGPRDRMGGGWRGGRGGGRGHTIVTSFIYNIKKLGLIKGGISVKNNNGYY